LKNFGKLSDLLLQLTFSFFAGNLLDFVLINLKIYDTMKSLNKKRSFRPFETKNRVTC